MSLLAPSPPLRTAMLDDKGLATWSWSRWFQGLLTPLPNVIVVAAAYTAQPNDTVLADTTTAGFTVTLPIASNSKNAEIRVIKTSADGNTLTIAGNGSDTINGSATKTTAAQYGKFTLICSGTAWFEF